MALKEKIIYVLLVIGATPLFAMGFIFLRFGISLIGFINISDFTLTILFLVLQIILLELIVYFSIRKQFALVAALIFGFIFSFGFGPMD